jgi:hypothetical protein
MLNPIILSNKGLAFSSSLSFVVHPSAFRISSQESPFSGSNNFGFVFCLHFPVLAPALKVSAKL